MIFTKSYHTHVTMLYITQRHAIRTITQLVKTAQHHLYIVVILTYLSGKPYHIVTMLGIQSRPLLKELLCTNLMREIATYIIIIDTYTLTM